ncbi:MAG: shikimate kinase [Candidatus Anstonellales archaeon]
MKKPLLFAVVGCPISHSRSPQMQTSAMKKCGLNAIYFRLLAKSAQDVLNIAREIGLRGMNVTSPLKEDIAEKLNKASVEVERLGACNTVVFKNGQSIGFNTDTDGVLRAFQSAGIPLKGKSVVVLGAGGSAKAAIMALTQAGSNVICANRTTEKAKEICKMFGCRAIGISKGELKAAVVGSHIIISCVSTHERIVPRKLLKPSMAVLDANYSGKSALLSDARKVGCTIISPLEWLLFQGASAFEIFTGRKAPINLMRECAFSSYPELRTRRKIALIGFMGSGKSTVGKTLSKRLGFKFTETDVLIEKEVGMSISNIFNTFGEHRFRDMESAALKKALSDDKTVISCGGGIVLRKENVALLKDNCFVIWLYAGQGEILKRTRGNKNRPLLIGKNRKETIKRLLSYRLPLYASACHIAVNTNHKLPYQIAELIGEELIRGADK